MISAVARLASTWVSVAIERVISSGSRDSRMTLVATEGVSSAPSPLRPCEAITMPSQPQSVAALTIASAGRSLTALCVSCGTCAAAAAAQALASSARLWPSSRWWNSSSLSTVTDTLRPSAKTGARCRRSCRNSRAREPSSDAA